MKSRILHGVLTPPIPCGVPGCPLLLPQASGNIMIGVKFHLCFTWVDILGRLNVITVRKMVSMPYLPPIGTEIEAAGCSPFSVEAVETSLDDGSTDIYLADDRKDGEEDARERVYHFQSYGWEIEEDIWPTPEASGDTVR